MILKVSTSSVEWFFFTWYGRKLDFFSIECVPDAVHNGTENKICLGSGFRKFDKNFLKIFEYFFLKFLSNIWKKSKIYFQFWTKKREYMNGCPKKWLWKNFYKWFLVKIWFLKILCYGKHRIWFWGHSPRESMGHCASENVGAAYGGNIRSETLGSSSVP